MNNLTKIGFTIFLFCFSLVFANNERGLTTKPFAEENSYIAGTARTYTPPAEETKKNKRDTAFNRDEWELIDSLDVNTMILEGKYAGVYFDNMNPTFVKASNHDELIPESKAALEKAPAWMRADLEAILSQLSTTNQQIWAGLINDAYDPYIDEIAFSIAHSSVAYLEEDYVYPELFIENAHLIYDIDGDLNYVEVIDYGTSYNDENYYSTTRYWKEDTHGILQQIEVPRDIYYWYVVHPKITDEIPNYISPDVIESNGSHDNNFAAPPEGVFWRNWLYNHNDEGYPKLKYYLQACDIVWDSNSLSSTNAVGATNSWIAQSMVFTSNTERPHQPVRIYRKHIGRCGEHADLRAAVLRIGLIPATSILTISTDHTWNEFWDEDWIHYDGGSVNNPLLYENGWGKTHASVFEIRSDGVLSPVSDKYSEGSANLTIYVLDANGLPVDGARILLGVWDTNQIRSDTVGFTDKDGKYVFIVGENRSYYARMTSDVGDDPMGGGYMLLVEDVEDGVDLTFQMNAAGSMPIVEFNEIDPPDDDLDDYRIEVEYTAPEQVISGRVVFDDIDNSYFYHCLPGTNANFFMTDLVNYCNYSSHFPFDSFNCFEAADEGSAVFDALSYDWWYAFFENYSSLNNPQKILGAIKLYRYEDIGGSGTISGNVVDVNSSEPIVGATVTAGVFSTITDGNGGYELEVFPQIYEIFCSMTNYETSMIGNISVSNGGETTVDIEMYESALMPQNVIAEENADGYAEISWNEPMILQRVKNTSDRDLESYNLYRGLCDEEDFVEEWISVATGISATSYTDTEWENLEAGIYKYAVEAVYSGNNISPETYSNDIYKDMFVTVTINVSTNSGDDPEGANANLSNQDNHPQHQYEAESQENGIIIFEEVWKGIYDISVSLNYFESYSADSLEIFEDTTLDITLNELLIPVFDLSVIDYFLTWNPVPSDRELLEYRIFIDEVLAGTIPQGGVCSWDLSGTGEGIHTAGVLAIYTTGGSEIAEIEYEDGYSTYLGTYAYYPFNGNVNDESGNGFNGEMNGDITFNDDVVNGQSLFFDEEAEYIFCPDVFADAPEAFTVSWWLNPAAHTNWNQQLRSPAGWGGFVFHSTNEGSFYVGTDVNNRLTPSYFNEGMILNEWQFYTFTYGNGRGRLFKNGNELAFKDGMADPESWNGFQIGHSNANTISGYIDEVRLWDRAIGTAEVENIYTEFVPFWGAIQGTVISAIDQSPVEGATITAGMFETETDSDGNYSFDVASATYNLICSVGDFDPEIIEGLFVGEDETVTIDFEYGFTGVEEESAPSEITRLHHNYPNPFQSSTTISFSTTESTENTEILIYNIKGQKVRTLECVNYFDAKATESLSHIVWNGKDENNKPVSSGIYFYKMKSGKYSSTKKMILMR